MHEQLHGLDAAGVVVESLLKRNSARSFLPSETSDSLRAVIAGGVIGAGVAVGAAAAAGEGVAVAAAVCAATAFWRRSSSCCLR
jgi:hypothetical protein